MCKHLGWGTTSPFFVPTVRLVYQAQPILQRSGLSLSSIVPSERRRSSFCSVPTVFRGSFFFVLFAGL